MTLPHDPVSPFPDDEFDAISEVWNSRYREIDDNFRYLNDQLGENSLAAHLDAPDPHPVYLTNLEGVSIAESKVSEHLLNTDPHTQYAPKASPHFTGGPTAPSPDASDASQALATTGFSVASRIWQKNSAYETNGTGGSFSVSGVYGVNGLTPNLRLRILFSADGAASNTINVNSLGAKQILQYATSGVKVASSIKAGLLSDIEYDGSGWILLNPLPPSPTGGTVDTSLFLKKDGSVAMDATYTIGGAKSIATREYVDGFIDNAELSAAIDSHVTAKHNNIAVLTGGQIILPLANGTAALGGSEYASRSDHVHPSDPSKANSSHTHSEYSPTSHVHTYDFSNTGSIHAGGSSGYLFLPGGKLIQWTAGYSHCSDDTGGGVIYFPIPFPNDIFSIHAIPYVDSVISRNSTVSVKWGSVTPSGFRLQSNADSNANPIGYYCVILAIGR